VRKVAGASWLVGLDALAVAVLHALSLPLQESRDAGCGICRAKRTLEPRKEPTFVRFLSTHRENEVIAYIQWLELQNEELEENRVQLEAAVKDAFNLQRMIVEDFIAFRDDPDVELNFDPDEMLLSLTDHIAILEEHFS
jgi:hypothetical protein